MLPLVLSSSAEALLSADSKVAEASVGCVAMCRVGSAIHCIKAGANEMVGLKEKTRNAKFLGRGFHKRLATDIAVASDI